MASRIGRRIFASAARAPAHPQTSGRILTRRGMSSSSNGHGDSTGSDTPWIIGSAAIFGPTIAYLLSPASRRPDPHPVRASSGHGEPKAPAETVESQPEPAAESEEDPQPDLTPEEVITDDEGTAVPAKEVAESAAQAVASDSPKEASEAEIAEARGETFSAGKPGQDAEAENKPDVTEKAHDDSKSGTVQPPDATGPTDLGAAREQSKEGKEPKQASDSS